MKEIWKTIPGYEGLYEVSNLGRVKSLPREYDVENQFGHIRHVVLKERILKIQKYSNGYCFVGLSKNGKCKGQMIHRLVALAYLPNPDNLPEVNHKDENIENNTLSNLEWCTSKYNANYGTRNERCHTTIRKPVNQLDKNGQFIKRWDSITAAHKALGIDISHISGVCKHKKEYVTAGGYKWEFA